MAQYIFNAIVGAFLLSSAAFLFQTIHQHTLNLSDLFWTLTVLKPKYLLEYLPVVSGLFFTSGLLFDWMQYDGYGKVIPYGPDASILARTSMYGFALGGFLLGFGGKLAEGDLIHHMCGEIYLGKWLSLIYVGLIFLAAIISSLLCGQGYLSFLTNQTVNPIMESLHFLSANVTIVISIVMFVISSCILSKKEKQPKKIVKRIGGSFASGVLLALAFLICGLTVRNRLFLGLTPTSGWDSVVLTFLGATLLCSLIIHLVTKKNQIKPEMEELQIENENENVKPEVKQKLVMKSVGAIMQGIGWGIAGLQFTTFLVHSAIFTIPTVIIFGLFLILGSILHDAL